MANNCLQTKLKASVNNDVIPYINGFRLDLSNCSATNNATVSINPASGKTLSVVTKDTDCPATISSSTAITVKAGYTYHVLPGEDIYMLSGEVFTNNYADIAKVKYWCTNLKIVDSLYIGGIIESVPTDNTRISVLNIANCQNIGNESIKSWIKSQIRIVKFALNFRTVPQTEDFTAYDLAELRTLTEVSAGGATKSIRVEDYVAKRRGLGDTSGTLTWKYITVGSTFNGAEITNRASNVLSWTANTITFGGVEIQNSEVVN